MAFISEWRLTLLLLAFTPFLVIAGFFMAKVSEREGVGRQLLGVPVVGYQQPEQPGAETLCISWGCGGRGPLLYQDCGGF